MTQQSYWLWLYRVLGPCSVRFKDLFYSYDYIEDIYENRKSDAIRDKLSSAEFQRAGNVKLSEVNPNLERCSRLGIDMLCYSDEQYPDSLRNTRVPPMILFATGDVSTLKNLCIAGVGSRNETQYGRDAVRKICDPLANAGVTLVSGLAYGIDTSVHRAAIRCGKPTIAVLGNSIESTYPQEHAQLRKTIENNGCVISEYEPGMRVTKYSFPQRNRIISGLSRAVVIFEAAKRSGTMITANWALDDGREVLAVPGNITSRQSEGTNLLIKQGANPATCAEDVLSQIGIEAFTEYEQTTLETVAPAELNPKQQRIYELLKDGEKALDELMTTSKLLPHELLSEITIMEMDGIIEALSGSRYKIR
ncbi:MAG: DNA-processing protein DprA [Oscillospiraceae bacterium]